MILRISLTKIIISQYMNHHTLVRADCSILQSGEWQTREELVIHSTLESADMVSRYSIGTFIKVYDKMYLIACYHGIDNHKKIMVYVNETIRLCYHVMSFPEYDLALIKVDSEGIKNYIDFEGIVEPIDNIHDDLNINSVSFKIFKDRIEKENIVHDSNIKNITFDQGKSYTSSRTIMLGITLKHPEYNIDLKGLSGSPVYSNNKFIGIISYSDHDAIKVIHTSTIDRLIRSFINTTGFCHIPIQTQCVLIDSSQRGLLITKSFDIEYTGFNGKRKNKVLLNEGDVITTVDSKIIKENGYIHDKNLSSEIPFDIFIFLNKYPGDSVDIDIFRKIDSKYYPEKIQLVLPDFHSMVKIPLLSDRYVVYNNIVYMELSEELIQRFMDKGTVIGHVEDLYENSPYGSGRVIVSVDIIKEGLRADLNDMYIDKSLPVYITDTECCIPVLSKIDNYKINSFDKMIDILKSKTVHKLTFETSDSNKVYITI